MAGSLWRAMEPVIHLRSAVSILDRFPALAGVDLDVETGEVLHLQGPNGAGKTTLLRVCAGLAPLEASAASVLGVDLLTDRAAVRPMVGFLAQSTFLYDELTAAENVAFFARAVGAARRDAAAALARVDLDRRTAEVPVGRLSTGQRRRASLAAMIVRRPRLWLLDEPHAGLDAAARDLVDDLVSEASGAGATVLVASHELDRAEALATRTVTVAGGVVVADEPAAGRPDAGAPPLRLAPPPADSVAPASDETETA